MFKGKRTIKFKDGSTKFSDVPTSNHYDSGLISQLEDVEYVIFDCGNACGMSLDRPHTYYNGHEVRRDR